MRRSTLRWCCFFLIADFINGLQKKRLELFQNVISADMVGKCMIVNQNGSEEELKKTELLFSPVLRCQGDDALIYALTEYNRVIVTYPDARNMQWCSQIRFVHKTFGDNSLTVQVQPDPDFKNCTVLQSNKISHILTTCVRKVELHLPWNFTSSAAPPIDLYISSQHTNSVPFATVHHKNFRRVHNIRFNKLVAGRGEDISCYADGDPQATYWEISVMGFHKYLHDQKTFKTANNTITFFKYGKFVVTCEASNTLDGATFTANLTKDVGISPSESMRVSGKLGKVGTVAYIVLSVFVFALLVIGGLVVVGKVVLTRRNALTGSLQIDRTLQATLAAQVASNEENLPTEEASPSSSETVKSHPPLSTNGTNSSINPASPSKAQNPPKG
ncbi:hypothetical protein HELRODRAFT_166100 [Helobdella robusta]|uniref:Ig-like domain-containing protein n=1 Tax=Helobdella robusta TaxID=6412 RepID=T1EXR6_HELRO|nr:hypothetical protein HELRODRAFT_166100 [Helobdella robusta]ESN90434.1 hypothetical protein HELRODRAFT_166100 [Helobdella robusta]